MNQLAQWFYFQTHLLVASQPARGVRDLLDSILFLKSTSDTGCFVQVVETETSGSSTRAEASRNSNI